MQIFQILMTSMLAAYFSLGLFSGQTDQLKDEGVTVLSPDNALSEEGEFIPAKQELGENKEVNNDSKDKNIQLTDEQIQELEELYQAMMEQRKALINKYVEYNMMSKEKAEKIMTRMDEHYEKMKEENFVPKWSRKKWKKCDCNSSKED